MNRLQIKRASKLRWKDENPVLFPGEMGFELDTGKLKIGLDDNQRWEDIPYVFNGHERISISDVDGLAESLKEMSHSNHEHGIGDIENLDTYLAGKSDEGHTHSFKEITDRFGAVLSTSAVGDVELDFSKYERFYLTVSKKVMLSVVNVPEYPSTYKIRLQLNSSDSNIVWPREFFFSKAAPPLFDTSSPVVKWLTLEVISPNRIDVFVHSETFF